MSENNGDETGPDSGKPNKSGLYIVCNGAKCKCNQSVPGQQADFEVLSQSTTYINDTDGAEKLVGSTFDLGIPFKVKGSTFGTCKLQPTGSSYLPCFPAVVAWSDAYASIVLDNMGQVLVKESTAQCAIGGTIEFATHGQEQEVTQTDAEEASSQPALSSVLTEEQVRELALGEFTKGEDKKGASVKSIKTTDGKSAYFVNRKLIPLKVKEYSKSSPTDEEKKGVNWAIFHKKEGEPISKYKQRGIYSDVGEDFTFPFKIEGDYVIEAYGSSKGPYFLKNKPVAAYTKITLKEQTFDAISVSVGGDVRTRVRLEETATIQIKPLFSASEMKNIIGENSVGDVIWDVKATSGGKDIPVTFKENPQNPLQLIVLPLNVKANVTAKATSSAGITKSVSYKVGGNYVTAIQASKKTVSVWESGDRKERHLVKLSVSEFIIEPALPHEKAAVKWTNFKPDAKPDKTHIIATGAETTRYFKSPGVFMYEAFMNSPEGGEKKTTKRVEGVMPEISKAYWADSKGNKISRSGFEHTVYLHIETLGLTGEKLKLNVWESDTYGSDFVKNAGTEVEITSNKGIINQEFTLPTASWLEQEYYFTIERLDFTLLGTKQDSDSNDEFVLWKNHQCKKVDYLYVSSGKKITSLKIYETGNKLHTGIVKYGDTLTINLASRNRVDEEIEFEIWKDANCNNYKGDGHDETSDDIKFSETIKIKIDKEGNGTTDFKIPTNWEDYQGTAKAQFFYLKDGDEEYPQANYTKGLNTKDETSKSNPNRIISLMIKTSNTMEIDDVFENASAVILGDELTAEEIGFLEDPDIIFPLTVKPENDKDQKWKDYYWAAKQKANQATFNSNRGGGTRKHAARDLYTNPDEPVVAIADGKVLRVAGFYMKTDQVTVLHETKSGRKFIVRYGELGPNTVKFKKGEEVKQGDVLGKTGKLTRSNGKPLLNWKDGIVYMLHFEYFVGSSGYNLNTPLSTDDAPYKRRKDLKEPLPILQEGYKNTFREKTTSFTKKEFTKEDAKKGLKVIFDKFGKEMAIKIERIYRWETAHFASKQFRLTGTGGMEAHGGHPNYGWDSKFFTTYPKYAIESTTSMMEGVGLSKSGGNAQDTKNTKQFVVFPSVEGAMMYLAEYINRYDGNHGRWFSTDAAKQKIYKEKLTGVKPRIVNGF